MPNRILKEGICTSEDIDALSPELEVFFYRLMVVCDDFGLMDARTAILKARCYPLKSMDIKRIQANLDALSRSGLIFTYVVDGKPYLSITNWEKHQQIRAKRAKFPFPPQPDSTCNQLISDAPVIQSNPIQSESESESESESTTLSGSQANTDPMPPAEKDKHPKAQARQLIDFLNERAGKAFRHTDANLDLVIARMREGYSLQELKTVTARKCRQWRTDEKMSEFLRPATLYNRTNFNQYIGECVE